MKSLKSIIRLHRLRIDEKRREVADLEAMRADLEGRLAVLEDEIQNEQHRAAQNIVGYAYANFVRAAIVRRGNIQLSIGQTAEAIAAKQAELVEAFRELKKFEVAEASRLEQEAEDEARRDRMASDEIALNIHRRLKI